MQLPPRTGEGSRGSGPHFALTHVSSFVIPRLPAIPSDPQISRQEEDWPPNLWPGSGAALGGPQAYTRVSAGSANRLRRKLLSCTGERGQQQDAHAHLTRCSLDSKVGLATAAEAVLGRRERCRATPKTAGSGGGRAGNRGDSTGPTCNGCSRTSNEPVHALHYRGRFETDVQGRRKASALPGDLLLLP